MPLDPQAEALLAAMPALPDLSTLDLAAVRAGMDPGVAPPGDAPELAKVEDRTIPGPAGQIRVRVYTPEGRAPFGGLVFFHGGGFVLCSLDSHDGQCRHLAAASGCVVVSVDYRLAPEHRFPAAPDDCHAAAKWVAEHADELGIDPARLAVGGDSAGGNLAAVTALRAVQQGGPALRFQLLIYPVTDAGCDTTSFRENAEGFFLTADTMRWFWEQYLPDPSHGEDPHASPLRAPDVAGLPPALVITAECDPLRDEGEAWAEKLREAGVDAVASRYDGMFHGFFALTAMLEPARRAVEEAGEALRKALR